MGLRMTEYQLFTRCRRAVIDTSYYRIKRESRLI